MDYVIQGHDYEHAVQTIIQVFFPNKGYHRLDKVPVAGSCVVSRCDGDVFSALVYDSGQIIAESCFKMSKDAAVQGKKAGTQAAAAAIFNALSEVTGYRPPWGTLTGVRPVKLLTEGRPASYLTRAYLTREDKADLCAEVARHEIEFIQNSKDSDVGIYIGIPFCPTRCRYCSFASYPLEKFGGFREAYFRALSEEVTAMAEMIEGRHQSNVTAVYIGGGTPVALAPYMLEDLLALTRKCFPGEYELCVEAGRPDALSEEKLRILKAFGATRLAINPQTMSNKTLAAMSRSHTAEDFIRVYNMARNMGFDDINCDVIIGLPGEGAADAEHTFKELVKLAPQSLTVHTLALKRAAEINHTVGRYGDGHLETGEIEKMLDIAASACRGMGLLPCYMYRQKNMAGNFENVGYAAPGFSSIYNHITMTEARTIYAAGAGAVTKVVDHRTGKIRRAFNVKNLDEYIDRIDEMIERKRMLL